MVATSFLTGMISGRLIFADSELRVKVPDGAGGLSFMCVRWLTLLCISLLLGCRASINHPMIDGSSLVSILLSSSNISTT